MANEKEVILYQMVQEEAGYKIVDELEKVAKNHNGTITQAALNYLLKK